MNISKRHSLILFIPLTMITGGAFALDLPGPLVDYVVDLDQHTMLPDNHRANRADN